MHYELCIYCITDNYSYDTGMCNTYNISRMNKLYAIYYISYIYACDLTSCIYTYSTDIKKVSKLAPNGAKTEKSPHTPHSFWMCKKQLPAPYRNSIAQFKNRPRPFERGHPHYLSRPKSVTLSVANSPKKKKSQMTLHSFWICTTN